MNLMSNRKDFNQDFDPNYATKKEAVGGRQGTFPLMPTTKTASFFQSTANEAPDRPLKK
jgi:hypothetical protein